MREPSESLIDSSLDDSSDRERRRPTKKKKTKKKKQKPFHLRPSGGGWEIASGEEESSELSYTEVNRIYEDAYMRQKGTKPPPLDQLSK